MVSPEALERFSFFDGLSQEELRSLSAIAEQVLFQRSEFIFREGEPADALYLLRDGWVDIVINTSGEGDRQELVTTLTPGEIFGWSAVVEPHIYTASALCASPVEAIRFGGAGLLALFEANPRLGCLLTRKICRVISDRLRAARLQATSLFTTR